MSLEGLMRPVIPGVLVLFVLAGCPMSAPGSPMLRSRVAATEITGHAYDVPQALEALLDKQTPANKFTLEIAEFETADADLSNQIFPDYRSAIAFAEEKGHRNFL